MAREYKVVVTETGDKHFILELDDDRCNYIEVWMRDSKENGGLEGYCVTINWKLNMRESVCWSKNIFGRGLYAEEMAERHFFAVCNCIINGYETCIEDGKFETEVSLFKGVRKHLSEKMCGIRFKVNQESERVEGDPIEFAKLFTFEKKWSKKKKIIDIVTR